MEKRGLSVNEKKESGERTAESGQLAVVSCLTVDVRDLGRNRDNIYYVSQSFVSEQVI